MATLTLKKHEPFRGTKMQGTRAIGQPLNAGPSEETFQVSPSSKTALARLSYPLKDLPDLCVYEVETFFNPEKELVSSDDSEDQENPDFRKSITRISVSKDITILEDELEEIAISPGTKSSGRPSVSTKEWNSIQSQRLRYKALTELLGTPQFESYRESITIHVGAGRNVDHIIVPVAAFNNDGRKADWNNKQVILTETKKYSIVNELGGKKNYAQSVKCTISNGRFCNKDQLSSLYWKSLEVVLRKRATPKSSEAKFGIAREFYDKLNEIVSEETLARTIDATQTDANKEHEVVLRKQISLNGDKRLLQIDLDLAMKLPRRDVLATLNSLMGGKKGELHNRITANLPAISRFTKGLRVRVLYASQNNGEAAKGTKVQVIDYAEKDKAGNTNYIPGNVFQITEIRMPDEVPTFMFNGEYITIMDYMVNHVLPEKRLTDADQKFPLAHDGKGHWYPLRMLALDDQQAWTRIPHLIPAIKEVGREVLKAEGQPLRRFGDELFKTLADVKKDEHSPLVAIDTSKQVELVQMDTIALTFL